MEGAGCAGAGGSDFHHHRLGGAGGEQGKVFGKVEGDRRDDFQALANLAFHAITDDSHGFIEMIST